MASASTRPDQKQDLQTLLECSICLETFDDPRTLPCLHSFCKKCLENFVNGKLDDDLNCPVCRSKFTTSKEGVTGMTRNHFICNMVEVTSIQQQQKCFPCSHCQEPSVGRCVTCELFMCEKCIQSHNGYLGFRDHVVLTMEELSKPENQSKIKKISKCNQHPKKKLKYYCETCDQLICRHCMDFDHDKQHKFSPLEQAAQRKRNDLKKTCETLERSVESKNQEKLDYKDVCQSLDSNFSKAQRLINEGKDRLLARFQKKTDSMIEDSRQVFDRKTREIEEKINEADMFVIQVKASLDMARSLLQNGNDEEIVRSYQSVQKNVEKENNFYNKSGCLVNYNADVLERSPSEIDTMLLAEIKDKGLTQDIVHGEIDGPIPRSICMRGLKEVDDGAELPPKNISGEAPCTSCDKGSLVDSARRQSRKKKGKNKGHKRTGEKFKIMFEEDSSHFSRETKPRELEGASLQSTGYTSAYARQSDASGVSIFAD